MHRICLCQKGNLKPEYETMRFLNSDSLLFLQFRSLNYNEAFQSSLLSFSSNWPRHSSKNNHKTSQKYIFERVSTGIKRRSFLATKIHCTVNVLSSLHALDDL